MKILLSTNLAFSALLATCMLQMGDEQSSVFICILSFFVILAGLILVDIQERFALTDGWANAVILLVVGAHLGVLLRSPTEFLAYSIASILVYVQMVLFFKKKETRVCFQLTTISFLQVCVGCVTEQGILFAVFLLIYCFSIVCVLTLLFLVKEREYYEKHAFIRPAFGTEATAQGKQGFTHLVKLALKTLFLTPIYVLFGSPTDEYEVFLRQDSKRSLPKFQFRNLWSGITMFLITPRLFFDKLKAKYVEQRATNRASRKRLPATVTVQGDKLFGFWEQASGEGDVTGPHRSLVEMSGDVSRSRFPLLYTRPVFSGANRSGEHVYLSKGLVGQLLLHSGLALVFAAIIFFVFPRFQKLEFGDLRFGHDGWRTARKQTTAAVGFSEHIQLGDLGPSVDNHEVVLTVAFSDVLNKEPITIKSGTSVYLRGITLVDYTDRRWNRVSSLDPEHKPEFKTRHYGAPTAMGRPVFKSNNAEFPSRSYHMGHTFLDKQTALEHGLFDPGNDLFCEQIQIVPFNSPVVFTVWPFFRVGSRKAGGFFDDNWFIRSINESFRYVAFDLYVNSFRDSRQVDLIPNQENVNFIVDDMLKVDETLLPRLCELARQWDQASNLDKSDIIGRAKNLEQQLRDKNGFAYYRYNVQRGRDIDPLEDFVSLQPKGHCEYFAGTLALMLRAIGIPSRIVIGFKANVDYSELSDRSIVRQSDAHSWVEAYIAPEALGTGRGTSVMFPTNPEAQSEWWTNGGWLRLDATPAYTAALFSDISKNYQVWLAIGRNFWNTYILNYNDGRQQALIYKPASEAFKKAWQEAAQHRFGLDLVSGFVAKTRNFLRLLLSGKWNTVDFIGGVIPLLGGILLCVWIWRKWLRYWFRAPSKELTPLDVIKAQAGFYLRLEKYFAQLDLTRRPSETPLEFVKRCLADRRMDDFLREELARACSTRNLSDEAFEAVLNNKIEHVRNSISENAHRIVDAYYQVRFGTRPLEPGETALLTQAADALEAPWSSVLA